jgi:hypothetical protein
VPFSHGKVLFTFVKNVVQIAFLAQWPLTVANISEKNFATEMKTGASPPPQRFDASYAPAHWAPIKSPMKEHCPLLE